MGAGEVAQRVEWRIHCKKPIFRIFLSKIVVLLFANKNFDIRKDLSGGTSMFPGMADRMQKELATLALVQRRPIFLPAC